MKIVKLPCAFEWDKGNKDKNLIKHRVTDQECEEVFFDGSKRFFGDIGHSGKEKRFIILGNARQKRLLFIVFTIRKNKIRIISARDVNKKERKIYEKAIENSKI